MRHYKMRQEWRGTEVEQQMQQIQALHSQLRHQSAAAKKVTLATIEQIVEQLHEKQVAGEYEAKSGKFVEETGFARKRS
jgi:hypothetical protein